MSQTLDKDTAVSRPMARAVGEAFGAAYGFAGELVSPLSGRRLR